MNILIAGSGKGSWDIRGVQLGAALGALVSSAPTPANFAWADVVVLVKRAVIHFGRQAMQAGKPIVWDALDFWSQPDQNQLQEPEAIALFEQFAARVRPVRTLGATLSMAIATGGDYLPHHAWPNLQPAPLRDRVEVVGYQGNRRYLGAWQARLEAACQARGWRFVVNPVRLTDADILVALRDGPWDGWICREWKSGVKVVNAMAAGRPIVTQHGAAWRELHPVGSVIETEASLGRALDAWSDVAERQLALEQPGAAGLTVDAIAADYRKAIEEAVACPA